VTEPPPAETATYCRICLNYCPIVATVADGRVARISGDRANPLWHGHTCVKGRTQHRRMYGPDRLLRSRKRTADGSYVPISSEDAMDEIADLLRAQIDQHGPRSVAYYTGTAMMANVLMNAVGMAFVEALGTPMVYTPATIDKPGKPLAKAMHGNWMAPHQGYHEPRVALLVGANPLISYEGAPIGNPGWLSEQVASGMELIVIDPRRTETARRATIHLQPRPGTDVAILAGLVRVILEDDLVDRPFVDRHVEGVEALGQALRPFSPGAVAASAGIESADLVSAARAFARAGRGFAFAGTGASMSDPGPLTEYLILCLESLCGHWLRAGERVENAPVLLPTPDYVAQASPPRPPRLDNPTRVRGLMETVAGLPTAALADEILLEGDGRVRVLICCGGNPVGAFPDRGKVIAALRKLDLLVQIDPVMSQTARLAHYVIAPKLPLETPDISQWQDFLGFHGPGFGNLAAHAQYAPAVVAPPGGADVIGEWEFFYGLARRMGLSLRVTQSCFGYHGIQPFDVDMESKPGWDELLEQLARGSRVPLDEVKRQPHGAIYDDPPVVVRPSDPDWPHRLDVGNAEMLSALADRGARLSAPRLEGTGRDFVLICRRSREMLNTWVNDGLTTGGRTFNPVCLHPSDLRELGVEDGAVVEIESAHGSVLAVAAGDPTLRRGVVTMTHGYGEIDAFGRPLGDDPRAGGAPVNVLMANDVACDDYSGMPPLSNIAVAVRRPLLSSQGCPRSPEGAAGPA
jgi:anaerobic selenocysteine-containing dehydrogenase